MLPTVKPVRNGGQTSMADQTHRDTLIPVLQETLQVGAQAVESGRVTVQTTVTEYDETIQMLLRREDLTVERVPIGRVVTETPPIRHVGDLLIVPVMEEVLVVEKRLMLKEEVHIRTTSSERMAQETVRLRTEHAEINQTGPAPSTPTAIPIKETNP
ncbi:MAG: YsnF/AvaK domain-containing protein [Gemmatimonadaceae bacterium]|nr:YsnF/AvaK domain-containing protein [Acetobacteraceae bacterium]